MTIEKAGNCPRKKLLIGGDSEKNKQLMYLEVIKAACIDHSIAKIWKGQGKEEGSSLLKQKTVEFVLEYQGTRER